MWAFCVQENSAGGETALHKEVKKAYCSVLWGGLSWKNMFVEFCEPVKKIFYTFIHVQEISLM